MTYHQELALAVAHAQLHELGIKGQLESVMRDMKGKGDPAMIQGILLGKPCECDDCRWAKRRR